MTRRRVPVTPCSVEIVSARAYRTPAWHKARRGKVSASEIASILGISPYQSRFDLWWEKSGEPPLRDDNRAMSRGRRVEPLVLEDFGDEHPEFSLRQVGLVENVDRPWQVCTPDQLAYESDHVCPQGPLGKQLHECESVPVAVVEAKTAGGSEGWGTRGTDEIPVHYRAQVLWQMDTLGLEVAYLPVWVGFDYRCYEVAYDAADVAFMRDQAVAFLDSLNAGIPPDVDDHVTTTDRLKRLHPSLVDEVAPVAEPLYRQYVTAKQLRDLADKRVRLHENRIRAAMGACKWLTLDDGRAVGTRSVYDVKASVQHRKAYTADRLNIRDTPKEKA